MSAPPHVTTTPPSPFSSHRTETRADERAHCGSRSPPPSSMMTRVRRESPSACSRPRRDVAVSPPPAPACGAKRRFASRLRRLQRDCAVSLPTPARTAARAPSQGYLCSSEGFSCVCWSHRSHPTPSRLLPDSSVEVVVVSLSLRVLPSQTRVWCGSLPVVVCCVPPPGSRSRAWSRMLRLGAQVQRLRHELLVVHVVVPPPVE